MPLFGFMRPTREPEIEALEQSPKRTPSCGIDSEQFEADVETDADEVQQEATEETEEQNEAETSKNEREEAKKACEVEWMNRARSEHSDDDYQGVPGDDELIAILELQCEATRAGTTVQCYVGTKRRLEVVTKGEVLEPVDKSANEKFETEEAVCGRPCQERTV